MATESKNNNKNPDGAPTASNIPDWLQAALFEDLLKTSFPGYRQIKNFKSESGTGCGENYATIMLRIQIEVELEDDKTELVSYMLKLPHQLAMFQEVMKNTNVFDFEREMYKNIVPEMEQLYRDAGVELKFGASSYNVKAPSDYVLLEDLRPRGFKNAKRLEGLDLAHTQSVLRKLAQWHAASAVRVATKGPYPEFLSKGFFTEANRAIMKEVNKSLGTIFLKCCHSYIGNEVYIEQVKLLKPNMTDIMLQSSQADTQDFNVLNHGDLWANNIMFQYDAAGNIKETFLVDYQLPKYGTVAQDLYYFLLSSTKFEDKLSKFDYYIRYYHENLVTNLKLLKYVKAIPTLRHIHMSLFKYGFWAFSTVSGVMAAVLLDPTENSNFENFLSDSNEGTDFKILMYSNARYRKHIEVLLPWLQNRGALEM